MAVGTLDGLAIVDLTTGAELSWQALGFTRPLGFDTGGALLTSGTGGLRRWPIHDETGQGLRIGPSESLVPQSNLQLAAASADGKTLLLPNFSAGSLLFHHDRPGQPICLKPQGHVRNCALSPDGTWAATGGHIAGGMKIWHAADGRFHTELFSHGGAPGFSPDGKWLATFTSDDCRLWEVGSWKPGPRLGGNEFAFAPDSASIAVRGGVGVIRLLRTRDGQELARLQITERTRLLPQCFTPDGGQLVAVGSESRSLHVWDLRALRAQLKELDLDWDAAELPPAPPPAPLRQARILSSLPLLYEFGSAARFGLTAVDELGQRRSITYSATGKTNHTLLRVNGKDVEFGGPGGMVGGIHEKLPAGRDGKTRYGHRSLWRLGDLHVTQVVELQGPDHKAALVRYVFENKGEKELSVGLRLLFDTKMGDNDGHPFALAGSTERITTSADWQGNDVPPHVLALEKLDPKDPGLTAVFSLKVGGGPEPPDRFCATHWPGDKEIPWEVPVRLIAEDAAAVLYWNARPLAAGARRDIAFAVGLTKFALAKSAKDLSE